MKLYRYILLFATAAAIQACSLKEDMPSSVEELPGITLTFFTQEEFAVKADDDYIEKDGEDPLNENLLASVEYFLYPDGKTDEDAVVHGYLTDVRVKAPYPVPMTDVTVTDILCPNNAKYFYVYAIANHSRIVAAASAGNPENLSGTSVAELEALTQELDDVEYDGDNHVVSNQSKFLMASNGPVKVGPVKKRQTTVASAKVDLERVAAKLSIVIRVNPQVTIKNVTTVGEVTINRDELWEPRMSEVTIYLVNGEKVGEVDGAPVPGSSSLLFEHAPVYFDYTSGESHSYSSFDVRKDDDGDPVDAQGRKLNSEGFLVDSNHNPILDGNGEKISSDFVYDENTHTGTFYPAETPFYSYPQKWFYGSDKEPYLKLTIPWDRVEYDDVTNERKVKQSKQYYYRVYCPGSTGDGTTCDGEFLRNHWYKVILNVGILGSETDGGEIVIKGTYFVADWQEREAQGQGEPGQEGTVNDSDKEAEIKGARYLFVNETEYKLYNINDLMIPYITSDPCEVVNFHAQRYQFSGTTRELQETTDKAEWGMTVEPVTTSTGAHINFLHNLDNNLNGSTYDVSEYVITFRIRQASNPDYYKDITIHQYPAIRIDLQWNSGSDDTNKGYAYVNASTKVQEEQSKWTSNTIRNNWNYYLGSSPGYGSSSNDNRNMVVIETTVLPSDSEFMLGDPRTSYIDNINASWPSSTTAQREADADWSYSSPSTDPGNRKLRYYYPVDKSNAANNIIAPKFRIASSWGATQPVSYANAFRRCAAYQEDGYPAGRWRLPTVAEIQYIAKLNADGKIKRLLGSDSLRNQYNEIEESTNYWSNSGYTTVYNGTNAEWQSYQNKNMPMPELGTNTSLINSTTVQSGNYVYIRCVYDDWYWGDSSVSKTTFTWGDAVR